MNGEYKMIKNKLQSIINDRKCTLLGVGPMSLNCVDATIDLSSQYNIPIFLIASRRQIDSEDFNGGYVNNWTTKEFADYVLDNDKKGKLLLARDHGGPWQNNKEVDQNLSLKRAMESAKNSYKADIDAGFDILHIDPSIDIHDKPNVDEILNRVFELYSFCWSYAQKVNKEVLFEIGTEEQSGSTNSQEELDYTLNSIMNFCSKNNIPKPSFVVIQSGTKVKEMKNVGSFDSPFRVADELPAEIQIPKMIEICNKYGIMMKEHNTDYLSNETLQWHPRLGIHASNVAPEFGVCETIKLIEVLEENGLESLANEFLSLSFNSKKWEKWMMKNSISTDRDKAIISGHYVFSTPNCIEIKNKASKILASKDIDLEFLLKEAVKKSILRYLVNFRMITKS